MRSDHGTTLLRTSVRCFARWDVHRPQPNLPIFSHTGIPGKSALEQLDILEDSGAKPQHIVIGHLAIW